MDTSQRIFRYGDFLWLFQYRSRFFGIAYRRSYDILLLTTLMGENVMIKYYDIGVNLFSRQFPDPEAVLKRAEEHGVSCILTGSDPQENEKINTFTKYHPGIYGTAGIHPHNADDATEDNISRIREIIKDNPRIVAVGECGLDYDRMFSTKENQIRILRRQMELAQELGKPMFLHEREASKDLQELFREAPELCRRSVIHCFTGNWDTLREYISMGFMIGITGWICDDRRAEDLRDAVSALPENRVMLETDAPYLTPKNVPGLARVNVPENIRYVARDLAYYMSIPQEKLEYYARQNTRSFFKLPEEKKQENDP